jgi:hypothetical protein
MPINFGSTGSNVSFTSWNAGFGSASIWGTATFAMMGAASSVAAPVAAPTLTPVTPTIDPKLEANALYGKRMVLSALGYARIGSAPAPIVGPYFNGGNVDFIVSLGVPADPAGTRKLYKIWFDNELAWSSVSGGTVPADGTFAAEAFDFVFKTGTLTQTVCSLETDKFGAEAIAYRPQMLIEIRNLPYQRFMTITGKPVPYVACDIGDTTDGADPFDGITIGEGYQRIGRSPWVGWTSSQIEQVNVTDVTDGYLLSENINIVQLGQSLTRIYRNAFLSQSDKLRLKSNGGSVTPDVIFNRDSIIGGDGGLVITRTEPSAQAREYELLTVDPDQDYTIVPSLSRRPRDPVVVSAAVSKQSFTLPVILDSQTRQALIVFAQYYDENARKKVAFAAMALGLEIEPGDLFALQDIADGIEDEVFICTETTHGADYTIQIVGEAIMRCGVTYNPTLEAVTYRENTGTNSLFNFNATDVKAAAVDRLLVISVSLGKSISPVRSVLSVTVNGVAATIQVSVDSGHATVDGEPNVSLAIATYPLPTGTTADIVVTATGNVDGCSIGARAVYGLGSFVPFDTASNASNGSNPTTTIDVPNNGIVIGGYAGVGGTPAASTWTGLSTKTVDESLSVGVWCSQAEQTNLGAQTGRTIAVANAASGREAVIAISFG